MQWQISSKVSDDLKTQLLANRGLTTEIEIEQFFNPQISDYQDDIEINGISAAIKRLDQAKANNELVVVYGDYDVDGICASTIAYQGFVEYGLQVMPFIPHRERDGYGLSKVGLDTIKQKHPDCRLIVTVDNGIVAIDSAEYAKSLGFDLIITDHHLPLADLPLATAIVHSTKMCGSAVIWCLIRQLASPETAEDLLQFVALGTVCDAIPLVGLGRAFVKQGLKILNQTSNPGLMALFRETGLEKGQIGAYEIGHVIGPKLNAVGRIDHALPALKLLCTNKSLNAAKYADQLMQANASRQDLTTVAVAQAMAQINSDDKIIVASSDQWIPGIIGLIAARLVDETARPAIAISAGAKLAKGSARSIPAVNIVEVLRQVSDSLLEVGGHAGAAGFSLETANIAQLKLQLSRVMQDQEMTIIEKTLEIELELSSKNINRQLLMNLQQFEPFGSGNPLPVFMTQNMQITNIKTVGSGKHLKFLADGKECIAFGLGNLVTVLSEGQRVNLAYHLEWNRFNGREILQLKVKDIH